MLQKEKLISLAQQNPKRVILLLGIISVILMLIFESDILVVIAAIFTFLYFGFWLKDNIRDFFKWLQKAKSEFAVFGKYADRLTEMVFDNKESKGEKR